MARAGYVAVACGLPLNEIAGRMTHLKRYLKSHRLNVDPSGPGFSRLQNL